MFSGFNLTLSQREREFLEIYADRGSRLYREQKREIETSLGKFVTNGNALDADLIEKGWFPPVKADVFLSHSHLDEQLVIGFAGYLQEKFGIRSFVDSCFWGYSATLEDIITESYCIPRKNNSSQVSWEKNIDKGYITKNVISILNGALLKLINSTECFIFMNTPNSISNQNVMGASYTSSPYIYNEISAATEFPCYKLEHYRKRKDRRRLYEKDLKFEYRVKVEDLCNLSLSEIKEIEEKCSKDNPLSFLNELYISKGFVTQRELREYE